MSLLTQLRGGAVLTVSLALLVGCQGTSSISGHAAEGPADVKSLPATVTLFGVQIGMTPDELNMAFPGTHCAPTSEHSDCRIPSTALGSSGIDVEFTDRRVSFAHTEGEISGGIRAVSERIAEQIGPLQRETFDSGSYAEVWAGADGSELALTKGHRTALGQDIAYPALYALSLSSPASREQHAREEDLAQRRAIAALKEALGKFLTIDSSGRMSICGISIGAKFDRHLGCSPDTDAELLGSSHFDSCYFMLASLPGIWSGNNKPKSTGPAASVCVDLDVDRATRQVLRISATFPEMAAEWSTISGALMSLENGNSLKLSDSLSNLPGIVSSSREYENNLGDVLTVKIEKDEIILDNPFRSSKLLTVSITGQSANEARFN